MIEAHINVIMFTGNVSINFQHSKQRRLLKRPLFPLSGYLISQGTGKSINTTPIKLILKNKNVGKWPNAIWLTQRQEWEHNV